MRVQRDFEPETARRLESVDIEKLEGFLGVKPTKEKSSDPQPSKWAKAVEEIEQLTISNETWEHIIACRKEFRNDEGV